MSYCDKTPLYDLYNHQYGKKIIDFESKCINNFSEGFYGNCGLVLGYLPLTIRTNILSGSWYIDERYVGLALPSLLNSPLSIENSKNLAVHLNPSELPFQNRSLELIIASHILDTTDDPESICREFVRVLSADGLLIITMFNPKSLIGHTKNSKFISKELNKTWRRLNAKRIREWLLVLGLEVEQAKFGIYTPINPLRYLSEKNNQLFFNNINLIGNRWFANTGDIMVMSARKRTFKAKLVGINTRPKILTNKPAVVTARAVNKICE